jgi:DNA polymerase-3 subunit delta
MSSTAGQKQLRGAIEERRFAPVYVLHGADDFRKGEALRQLVDAAVDPTTRDFNLEIRRAADTDAETLGSLLSMPPMMAERRAVVIRDVGALKKDARAALDAYLKRPAPDTVLVLVAPADGKLDKALLEVGVAVEFDELTGDKLEKWIAMHARNLGATIDGGAVSLLLTAVGNDLPQLAIELEKLAVYSGANPIDEAAVGAIVGIRQGETLADLLQAIASRDAARAAELLPGVLDQPKMSAVPVVMNLGVLFLGLAFARARRDARMPAAGLKNELFGLLKSTPGLFLGQSWGAATDTWAANVDRWTAADIDRALALLLATDRALKESRVSTEEATLLSFVLAACAPTAATRAA